jgi:hypothetical protein
MWTVLRIRDVYPGSRILIFTHPGSRIQKQQQKRGVKKNYFSFEVLKKKIWANFQRIIELFAQKIFTKLSKVWVWDPGSGKNLFRIPDLGVKKAPDPGSESATLVVDPDPYPHPQVISWIRILIRLKMTS